MKSGSLMCIAALVMNSCTPDNNFSIGQPENRISQLSGAWKLQNVNQVDLIAKSNNFVDPSRTDISLTEQDITNIAPFTDMVVTFATSPAGPTTFSIDYGQAPKIFKLNAGTWKVDDIATPGTIKFINGVDTVATKIGSVNLLSAGMLTLQVIKYQGIKPVIEYDYKFKKN